jgi:U4/U6 small nuclear ribonucleoprotein PRP4
VYWRCFPPFAACPAGGDDNTAKIWDLRQRKLLYTLPAHTSLISTVRWQPGSGHVLLTAGFDRQVCLL